MTISNNICLLFCIFIMYLIATSVAHRSKEKYFCPEKCKCFYDAEYNTTYQCKSLDFVNAISSDQLLLITKLDLSNTSSETIDKKLRQLKNIEWLNLSNNKIKNLKYFPQLPKLKHLILRTNNLKSFSSKMFHTNLTTLDVSSNFITGLPKDIINMHSLKIIDVHDNPFSCNRESLEIRDYLFENNVKLLGPILCQDPDQFKGQSWLQVDDLDDFFKIDEENIQADEPEGSGNFEGSGLKYVTDIPELPTTIVPIIFKNKKVYQLQSEKNDNSENDIYFETREDKTEIPSTINTNQLESQNKYANLGTHIFLGLFLLCLISLLVYAIKKHKEKRREARRKRRNELLKQRATIELVSKIPSNKPNDKPNGKPESTPLINIQNGNSTVLDPNDKDNDEAVKEPLLKNENNIKNEEDASTPNVPSVNNSQSDIKSVKIKVANLPDSVPHTPILVTRSRTSDGNVILTPKLPQKNS